MGGAGGVKVLISLLRLWCVNVQCLLDGGYSFGQRFNIIPLEVETRKSAFFPPGGVQKELCSSDFKIPSIDLGVTSLNTVPVLRSNDQPRSRKSKC